MELPIQQKRIHNDRCLYLILSGTDTDSQTGHITVLVHPMGFLHDNPSLFPAKHTETGQRTPGNRGHHHDTGQDTNRQRHPVQKNRNPIRQPESYRKRMDIRRNKQKYLTIQNHI